MLQWYALHAKPHKERQVEAALIARGIQVYFPTVPTVPRRGRPASRAFFPRYLFVQADIETIGLWTLHYAPGAAGVVMFGGIPARVDDAVIAALQARLARVQSTNGAGQVIVDQRGEIVEPGDRVAITSGPLADLDAVFDRRLTATGRVRVLVRLLQRWTGVELDADALEKTGGIPRRDLVDGSSTR